MRANQYSRIHSNVITLLFTVLWETASTLSRSSSGTLSRVSLCDCGKPLPPCDTDWLHLCALTHKCLSSVKWPQPTTQTCVTCGKPCFICTPLGSYQAVVVVAMRSPLPFPCVSLIVLTRSCSRRWGPCPSLFGVSVLFIHLSALLCFSLVRPWEVVLTSFRLLLSYATWLCVFGFLCLRFGFWIFYDSLFIYFISCRCTPATTCTQARPMGKNLGGWCCSKSASPQRHTTTAPPLISSHASPPLRTGPALNDK